MFVSKLNKLIVNYIDKIVNKKIIFSNNSNLCIKKINIVV